MSLLLSRHFEQKQKQNVAQRMEEQDDEEKKKAGVKKKASRKKSEFPVLWLHEQP